MKKVFILLTVFISLHAKGQIGASTLAGRTINTAVPFLRITPDASAGGMGDAGIATSPNLNSIYWNTAKLAFAKNKFGIGFTYSPWLKQLVNDIFLFDLSSYRKIDSVSAITASIRYFSLGSITFTNMSGIEIGNYNPREFTAHVGYSRKLAKHFSTGINLAYIYSSLAYGQSVSGVPVKASSSLAGDLSCYYSHPQKKSILKEYDLGFAVSYIGNKIVYPFLPMDKNFLPTNIGIGSAFHFQLKEKNQITVALDANKIVVPNSIDPINFSFGSEYVFNDRFFLRGGYFYAYPKYENRQYVTSGLGFRYHAVQFDASYLTSTFNNKNPLDNTFRFGFSLLFPNKRIS